MNHGGPLGGIPVAQEFQQFLHRLVKAGWKVETTRLGAVRITTADGATIMTQTPSCRAEFLDLRSKCVQMGLR